MSARVTAAAWSELGLGVGDRLLGEREGHPGPRDPYCFRLLIVSLSDGGANFVTLHMLNSCFSHEQGPRPQNAEHSLFSRLFCGFSSPPSLGGGQL